MKQLLCLLFSLRVLLLFFSLSFSLVATAQHRRAHTCAPILWQAEKMISEEKSVEAQNILNDLNVCDRKNEMVVERNRLQNQINTLNEQRIKKALEAERRAIAAKNAEIEARLATVREQMRTDSIKVRNYNMRQALSTAQEDPSLAWSMVQLLGGESANYQDLAEVVFSVANDPKNETYLENILLDQPILSIAWNASEELLVADAAGKIHRYSRTGKHLDTETFYQPLPDQQMLARFNSDASLLFFTRGEKDDSLVVRDVAQHSNALTLSAPDRIFNFAVSPALQYIALGLHQNLYCYNFSRDSASITQIPFEGWPAVMSMDKEGILTATVTDQPLRFYDLNNGGAVVECTNTRLAQKIVRSAAFTDWPDLLLMGGTSFEAALCKWNQQVYYPMNGHTNNVTASDLDYARQIVATGSSDKTVRLWEMKDDQMHEIAVLKGHHDPIERVVFSKDGNYLASADDARHLRIWRVQGRKSGSFSVGQSGYVNTAQFSPDSRMIAAGSTDGHLKFINMEDKKEITANTPLRDTVMCLAFLSNKQIVSGSSRGSLCVWNVGDSLPLRMAKVTSSSINALAVGIKGAQLVIGCEDGFVRIFNERLDSIYAFQIEGAYPLRSVSFLGEELVVADSRGNIRFYNKYYTEKNNALKTTAIHVAAISASGHYMLTANSHDIRLWDLHNPKRSFDLEDAHTNRVSGIAFSPDERFLFSVSWDGSALVWTRSGKKMYKVQTNASAICVAAASDGRSFATGSGSLDIWRTPDSYLSECVSMVSPEELATAGVLVQELSFYKKTKDINLLRKSARRFADIGSLRTADTLYALALMRVEEQLLQLHRNKKYQDFGIAEEEDELQSLKVDIQTDRAEMHIESLHLDRDATSQKAWEVLLNSVRQPNELELYANYFFTHNNWQALKHTAERYHAVTGTHTLWSRKFLHYARVMLLYPASSLNNVGAIRDLETLEDLALFFARESDDLPDSLMVQKATLAQSVCDIMEHYDQLHPNDTVTVQYLIDRYVNAGWYQLLAGNNASALKDIEAGLARCKKIPYPVSDSLLQMNRAHALLLGGKKTAALAVYTTLAPYPFIDNRYKTFADAFIDDFRLLRASNTALKGRILNSAQQADIKEVEQLLRDRAGIH